MEPSFNEPFVCTQTGSAAKDIPEEGPTALIEGIKVTSEASQSSFFEKRPPVRFTTPNIDENWEFLDEWGERTYHFPITYNSSVDLHLEKQLSVCWDGVHYTCNLSVKNISSRPVQIDLKSRCFKIMFADVREYMDGQDGDNRSRCSNSSKCIVLTELIRDGAVIQPGEVVAKFIDVEQELAPGRYDVYITYDEKKFSRCGPSSAAISNIVSLVVAD
jgi:hypothetical protein